MWEPRRLTTLWASTACYRDSFALLSVELESSHVKKEVKSECKEKNEGRWPKTIGHYTFIGQRKSGRSRRICVY
jgi:hypothetical protein